jgi:hypothetical protein
MAEESDRFRIGGKRELSEYEETKKEFEKVIITPSITITIELPEDFKEAKKEFLQLEQDEEFYKAVSRFAAEFLKKKQTKQ